MVEVVVTFNSKKVIADVKNAVTREKVEVIQDLYQTIKRKSPVRSGKFKRSWTKTVSAQGGKINNPQPYSQRLEEGYSRQAPLGVVKPAIAEVIKRRQTIRRK